MSFLITFAARLLAVAVAGLSFQATVLRADSLGNPLSRGCTYYASPAGGGDGSSPSNPFRIAKFWTLAKPGMSLCLLDGVYRGADSMISPPANVGGSRTLPIVVKAVNDGKVLIDGQSARRPVYLNFNDWMLIEGVNACCSSATVVEIANSSNDVIRRVAGWDAHDGNDKIFGVHYATHNLLEDVAGWGTGRKIFESSFAGDFTTIRRAWGRWERSTVVGPKMVYSLAYNNYGMLVENSLGTWSAERMPASYTLLDYSGQAYTGSGGGIYTNFGVDQPYGIFSADGLADDKDKARARLLGSVAYTTGTDVFKPQSLLFFTKIDGVQIRDTVGFYDAATQGGRYTFELHSLSGSNPQNDVAANVSSFGRAGASISGGWQSSNVLEGNNPSSVYALGETLFDTSRGATLCYAYEDGILTNRPLWPWPMNDRIRDALPQSGRAPLDIMSTMQQIFGVIPAQCTAASPSSPTPQTLPVAGRIAGWTTDLVVANPGDRAAEALLTFTPGGGLPPVTRTLFLRARQSVTLADAIQTVFGYPEAVGSLRLLPGTEAEGPLELHGRVYIASSGGTMGAGIGSATVSGTAPGLSRFLTGLSNTAAFRSNIGAANGSDSVQTFQIAVRDSSGSLLGTTNPLVLQPDQQMQWSLPSLLPAAVGQPLMAEFRPVGASTPPLGYAMVVDNASGDPTYFSSSEPAMLAYLPAVARISGAGGTLWATDVILTNPADVPARFTVTFLEHDHDNTAAAASRNVSLGAHETIQAVDVLNQWFNRSETYGALRVTASSAPGAVLSARAYTRAAGSGSVGQQISPVRADDLLTAGSLSGLREDDEFRSILGFLNPGASTVSVQAFLQNSDGASLASATVSIPPSSYVQRSLKGLFPAIRVSPGQLVAVAFTSGPDSVAAFASMVDNGSQDITLSRAVPGGGRPGPPAGPSAAFTVAPACQTCKNTMQFTDASTNSPISWSWDFGDGGTSTAQNPAHYFAASGSYTVTLTVGNAIGTDSANRTVTITLGAN